MHYRTNFFFASLLDFSFRAVSLLKIYLSLKFFNSNLFLKRNKRKRNQLWFMRNMINQSLPEGKQSALNLEGRVETGQIVSLKECSQKRIVQSNRIQGINNFSQTIRCSPQTPICQQCLQSQISMFHEVTSAYDLLTATFLVLSIAPFSFQTQNKCLKERINTFIYI